MSAIADFKKRRIAAKAKQKAVSETGKKLVDTLKGLSDEAKENTALKLLAQLLGCDESKAIETAQEYVDQNITFFDKGFDPANGEEQTVFAEVTLDDENNVESVEVKHVETTTDELNTSIANADDAAESLADSAEQASSAASNIESAADKASDAASDLAYSADDIHQANSELKETVDELKKPSEEQKSSNSKSKTQPKSNSQK
jgi:myosin heavy subunit